MRRLSLVVLVLLGGACHAPAPAPGPPPPPDPRVAWAFLDTLEERTFRFFWERADPRTGLVPDRWPTPSFSSIAAVGFGLTAYPIGVERGYVTRAEARRRVLATLDFFLRAPQGPQAAGGAGHRGFFYHFLDMTTGRRFGTVELSTIDTTLLLGGVLFCQSYFDGDPPEEQAVREKAEELFRRVDWRWAAVRPPLVSMGWKPESGFLDHDWRGYNEAMLLYVLALASPTSAVDESAWSEWTRTYTWGTFQGQAHVAFGPLFGHQYSHVFLDFRGIRDAYMRGRGIDYFENSRRATYAQRGYAALNPLGWKEYGPEVWGLTACDGPADARLTVGARPRTFWTYSARGVSLEGIRDDGTIAPTAAAASLPFAPEIVLPALLVMRRHHGGALFSTYGFIDAFNPSFPGGWVDTDYLGIDQGPMLAMIENHRTGLVWRTLRRNPHVVRGLRRAGFTGGWLEEAAATP
jgi:hypothetical protein